jgi:predicted PurR-regulated permease PerM
MSARRVPSVKSIKKTTPPIETSSTRTASPPEPLESFASGQAASWNLPLIIVATVASVFALHWAQRFFIPLILGILVAYTLNPVVSWMERHHIHRILGSTLVMIALLCVSALALMSLRDQVQGILDRVPEAASKLSATLRDIADQPNAMQKMQAAARELERATNQAADGSTEHKKPPTRVVVDEPKFKLVDLLWTGSMGMFGIMGETVMLVLLVLFLLLSGDTFKRKLMQLTGPSLSKRKITVAILDDIDRSIQNYMLTLLFANVVLALLTWAAFRWIGLENAGAWGVAAGVLHFIPYLGPVVTALATGMAAFLQFESLIMSLLVVGSSLLIATLVGMVLVTWMSGKMTKMNTTVVFIALLFWGWLWGAWGLLLAIPIMGMVKVFAEHVESLRPLAELLGE